ncbi:MAG: hypothetical protein NC078_02470 [Ruminococcus sp.]|nr:hypothetical protein [Ruminococcus sp.]
MNSGKISAPECIGIFYPKRGFGKYIGLPFLGLLILAAVNILFTLFVKNSGDMELQEFLKLTNFLSLYGLPGAVTVLETVSQWTSTARYAGKSPRRLILLRTSPRMERTVKNAFLFDEIRRAGLCLITGALAAASAGLTGQTAANMLIPLAVYTAASMFLTSAVTALIVRFINNMTLMLLLIYIWMGAAGGLGTAILTAIIYDGVSPYPNITLALIFGIAMSIIGSTAAVKRVLQCRHPEESQRGGESV